VDGTRLRRTRDEGRKQWYAIHRQRRFARFVWGLSLADSPEPGAQLGGHRISFDGTSGMHGNWSFALRVTGPPA
jgi:hypothetical protein